MKRLTSLVLALLLALTMMVGAFAETADVTGEWYTSSGFKTDSTDAYNANTAFTVDGGSITNTPGVVLPGTGGEGLNKMYTAGFLAVAIAVAGLALSLRRRQS
mgnify:CR=1 FL=1